jgi:hypothetical protein
MLTVSAAKLCDAKTASMAPKRSGPIRIQASIPERRDANFG